MSEPAEWQVDAALAALREEFDLRGYVQISDFITSLTDPPPGPGRDAALAAYRAAEEAAEERVRAVIRRALEASASGHPGAPEGPLKEDT